MCFQAEWREETRPIITKIIALLNEPGVRVAALDGLLCLAKNRTYLIHPVCGCSNPAEAECREEIRPAIRGIIVALNDSNRHPDVAALEFLVRIAGNGTSECCYLSV